MDNCINVWVKQQDVWDKIDSEKPQIAMLNKCSKWVHDAISNIYPSVNMNDISLIKDRIRKIRSNRKQLRHLKTLPFVEQRSAEWHAIRKNLITASDFGDALGIEKFGKKGDVKKFYQKKCGYDPPPVFDTANVFLKWGVMFEEVACNIYKSRTGSEVHEFGILVNPKIKCLGASPDGINDMGVMLEIKCPYKRKITDDSILKQYYYQIQGQLDACDLTECDFVEVKLDTYHNEASFFDDYEDQYNTFTELYMEKGIVIELSDTQYMYSPHNIKKSQLSEWIDLNRHMGTKIIFWYLDLYSQKRVNRNDIDIDNMNIQLKDVWDNVLKYRADESLYNKECKSATKKPREKKVYEHPKVGSIFIHDPLEV